MRIEDRDDFIDQVAQAVIDRIEERDRISGMVEMVVQRVFQLQREEAALRAAAQASDNSETPKEDSVDEPTG
jgi:predicted metal-dependent phosphotriesterase family hydrolase